jgi:D-glycero-alpha-D-manno-heptose-7-phosphate kinase
MLVRSKAPLRLGFAGGGTDVSPYCDEFGGYILNATIDMYAYCTIEVTDTGTIAFHATDRNEHVECPSTGVLAIDGNLDLHKGVYNRIVREFNNGQPLSFCMTTYSDAPAGSGLGSSSTLVVAMVAAFSEWLKLPLGEYDMASIAYEVERNDIGLAGGRQDQYAATFGGFNFMEFYKENRVIVNPLRIKSATVNELENALVLYYSGASRESAVIIQEQIDNTHAKHEKAIDSMHKVKSNALVMKEHLLRGNIRSFAQCLSESWESKKGMAASITNASIEKIFTYAQEHGAIAGKVSGAGGGGYMMLMANPENRMTLVKALDKLEGEVVNVHFSYEGVQSWTAEKF